MWADMDLAVAGSLSEELSRSVTFYVQNVTLREALERALSTLGITWNCNLSTGVISLMGRSHQPEPLPTLAAGESTAKPASVGNYVGKISIPMDGGRYFLEFMLRESDLPEELQKLRRQAIADVLAELSRKGMTGEIIKRPADSPVPQ